MCMPRPWYPCPKCRSTSRTIWINVDQLRLLSIQWRASEVWCQEIGCWSDRISVTSPILHQVAWWASPAESMSALKKEITLFTDAWVGVGAFLRWWPPSAMWAGPLIYYGRHWGCLNNPIFLNLGLCAACWAYFMCHYELWPTSMSHPFSFLNSSLGLAGRNHYHKITIPIDL